MKNFTAGLREDFTVLPPRSYFSFCKDLAETEKQLNSEHKIIESIQLSTCSRFGRVLYSAIVKSRFIQN